MVVSAISGQMPPPGIAAFATLGQASTIWGQVAATLGQAFATCVVAIPTWGQETATGLVAVSIHS